MDASLGAWSSAPPTAAVCLLSCALLVGPSSPPLTAQLERFKDTTSVVVVEVPVTVLRDGEPVRALTAADFEILDNGKRQEITSFEVIDLQIVPGASTAATSTPVPLAARRHFLLLFDLSFSEPASITRAREAALQLVNQGLHATDLAAVASYSESLGAQIVLGFTPDREQIARAVELLGVAEPNRHFADPLGLSLMEVESTGFFAGTEGGREGGRPSEFEQARAVRNLAERDNRSVKRNQILAMASSFGSLARLMSGVQGRKHVILLSEGFDSSILLGTEDFSRIAEMADDASHGEFWMIDSDERYGSGAAQTAMAQMVEEFRRADCVVQTVDIGGLRAAGGEEMRRSGEQGLFYLANETGGELYRNYNQLDLAMGEMLERTAVTYVLTFQLADLPSDGRYHRLKVRLDSEGPGIRLVHRPGYYAPRPYSELGATERQLDAAGLIVGGAEGGELDAALLAAAFPTRDTEAFVPVLLEVGGETLLANRDSSVIPAELYVYAIRSDGVIQDHFSRLMTLDVDKVGETLRQSGLKFWGQFELPPGRYLVRALVRRGDNGWQALRVANLEVPDLAGQHAALQPPFFPEPVGKWLLTREPNAIRDDVPYPFMFADEPFIPAAGPVLAAREEARLAMVGYHLGSGPLVVEGRLLDEEGTASPVTLSLSQDASAAGEGTARLFGTLHVGSVATGSYRLEVTVHDRDSGRSATSSIAVTVR